MKGLPVGTQPDRIFVWVLIKHKVNVYGTGLDSFAKYANRLPATVERWQLCFPLPFKHNSTDIGPTGPVIAIDLGTVSLTVKRHELPVTMQSTPGLVKLKPALVKIPAPL